MTARAVWRYAEWTLSPDTSRGGPVYEAECVTCWEASDPSDGTEAPEIWSLKHAGRTGHTEFRNLSSSFSRASMAEESG